ncbi:hypothetical protein GCM10023083_79360 [Streptomyces phyllanthi]
MMRRRLAVARRCSDAAESRVVPCVAKGAKRDVRTPWGRCVCGMRAPSYIGAKGSSLYRLMTGFWTETSAQRTGSLLSLHAYAPWQRRRGAQP